MLQSGDKTYELGQTLTLEGKEYRIVRIVVESLTLRRMENAASVETVVESYLQLINEERDVEFINLSSKVLPYDGPPSKIKALPYFKEKP